MRLVLILAVIALVVDALYYSGAYTQSAFKHMSVATEQLRARLADEVRTTSDGDTPNEAKQL